MNTGTDHLAYFRAASEAWATDGVYAEIRLIGRTGGGRNELLKASVQLGVNPNTSKVLLKTDELVVAKQIVGPLTADQASELRVATESGKVAVDGAEYSLPDGGISYYSRLPTDDEWNYTLNLTCRSNQKVSQDSMAWAAINAQLRCADIPFDGIADVCQNLALPNPSVSTEPQIDIFVHSPAELVGDGCTFVDDELSLKVQAFNTLDPKKITLGLRWSLVPFDRQQVGDAIEWSAGTGILREGRFSAQREKSDGALVMLSVGGHPVRRQWVLGSHVAKTVRAGTIQAFDPEWKRLRKSLLGNSSDSKAFERAIATLAFLLGFQVAPYTDSEAPDLALFSESGRVILVECTLKTSDVQSKMGKLVDRRVAATAHLSRIGAPAQINCLLVCASTREQVLVDDEELKKASVHLITHENLDNLLLRIRFNPSADLILNEMLASGAPRSL